MGDVTSLDDHRPRSTNLACPGCGSEWWRVEAVVVDADTRRVNAHTTELTCQACGEVHR